MLPYLLPAMPCAVAALVFLTEWRLGPSEDHAWQFGLLALGRWREVDWTIARDGLFGWIVKGFFLPMNFCTAVQYMHQLPARLPHLSVATWPDAQLVIMQYIFVILLLAILPGYVFSSRLLGTHNRWVDATAFGWFVTLLCYPPLNQGAAGWFFFHEHEMPQAQSWILATGSDRYLSCILGGLIILCELIHYWGEATCGLRSSHLSHRGVITNGIFRFSKHPVYTIKCIGWALIWLPFCTGYDWLGDLRQSLGFLALCGVYVLRGWVEERILSNDPAYISYACWMENHSLFRFMGRMIPFFNYNWRLEWWLQRKQVTLMPWGADRHKQA